MTVETIKKEMHDESVRVEYDYSLCPTHQIGIGDCHLFGGSKGCRCSRNKSRRYDSQDEYQECCRDAC